MAIRNDLLIHDAALKKTKLFERVLQGYSEACISLIVHEPTRRVWVINSDSRHHKTTTVVALCLDTGAAVVPEEVFNQSIAGRLVDTGFGLWKMGCWGFPQGVNGFGAYQLCIDVGCTTGAIRIQEYPPNPLGVASGVMGADSWETDRSAVLWEDVSWSCLSRNVRFTWDQMVELFIGAPSLGSATEVTSWMAQAVCEEYLVVSNKWQDLGIFRFEGVHERPAEPAMTDKSGSSRWLEGGMCSWIL